MAKLDQQSLDEVVERLLDDRVAQGFDRVCSDPSVLARIADALRGTDMFEDAITPVGARRSQRSRTGSAGSSTVPRERREAG